MAPFTALRKEDGEGESQVPVESVEEEYVIKPPRNMGMPCQSTACKTYKLNCHIIDEEKREDIFNYFNDSPRLSFCFLCVDGLRLRVCQKMFLSALGIQQWSFLKWVGRREGPEKSARP